MKILRRVRPIEVKRAYVTSQKMRLLGEKGKRYLPKLSKTEFVKQLKLVKKNVNELSEKQLDRFIADEYSKRAIAYATRDWYRAKMSSREIGVWRRAGGLPLRWTCGSLAEIAAYVKEGLKRNSKRIHARSKRAIPRMLGFADVIYKEKCLSPIVFAGGTWTRSGKWRRNTMKGDADDGCMRAIVLAVAGHKTLNVYFGKPKK